MTKRRAYFIKLTLNLIGISLLRTGLIERVELHKEPVVFNNYQVYYTYSLFVFGMLFIISGLYFKLIYKKLRKAKKILKKSNKKKKKTEKKHHKEEMKYENSRYKNLW